MMLPSKVKTTGLAVLAAGLLCLSAGTAAAQGKGSMHVGFGDIPGVDMLNFLTAVQRAEKRGVEVKVTYLQSEDIASQAVVSGPADIGVGTPYALIQKVKAPIRMFYQLARMRFFPVVNTEKYKDWKDLDGEPIIRMKLAKDRAAVASNWAGYETQDDLFHRSVAEASDNILLLALFDQLNQVRRAVAWGSVVRMSERPPQGHTSFVEQDRIAAAIEARDPTAAHEAMRRHIRSVSARLFEEV
jgi:hypothetical protein